MSRTEVSARPAARAPLEKRRRLPRRVPWTLVPPAAMAVLGAWLLAQPRSLWYDELYTAEVAPVPLGRLFDALVHGHGTIPYLADAPPSYSGPYYAVAHLWLRGTGLSPDELGLRLLSVVAAVAAIAVFTRAAVHLAGTAAGVAAGLVAATNPFVVQYAAEARGYSLALLANSCAALGFARWLDDRPRALLLYGLGLAAAGMAHWFALLVGAAFAVGGLVVRRRRALSLLGATAAATVPTLMLIATALANGTGASGADWILDVGLVPVRLLRLWSGGFMPLLWATAVAACVGVLRRDPEKPHARVVAATWVGVPVAVVTAVEQVRPVFVGRYLLPALLGLALLVGLAVRARRPVAVVLLGAVLAASLWSTAEEVRRGPKENVRGAVGALARAHRSGQPVVAATPWDALGLDHYARRDHPALVPDIVLPPATVPVATTLWVVRRSRVGVKGDRVTLAQLDQGLAERGMRVAEERGFPGRYSQVVVQRWEPVPSPH